MGIDALQSIYNDARNGNDRGESFCVRQFQDNASYHLEDKSNDSKIIFIKEIDLLKSKPILYTVIQEDDTIQNKEPIF